MTLLLFEPRLCSLYELQNTYSLTDFYDMLEIVDVQRAITDESRRLQAQEKK
jgi:hypothetical protein